MDNVREVDASIYTVDGVKWVQALVEGISTYSVRKSADKRWWSLPAGSPVPGGLTLYDDTANLADHYLWKPSTDMPLEDFKKALASVGPWTRVRTFDLPWSRIFTRARGDVLAGSGAALEGEQPMGWESKTHRYILAAVDAQVRELRARLARYPADPDSDEAAEAANDLLFYEAISAEITRRGPAPLAKPEPASHHGPR